MVESNEFDSFKLKLGNKGPLAEYNGIRFAGVFFASHSFNAYLTSTAKFSLVIRKVMKRK